MGLSKHSDGRQAHSAGQRVGKTPRSQDRISTLLQASESNAGYVPLRRTLTKMNTAADSQPLPAQSILNQSSTQEGGRQINPDRISIGQLPLVEKGTIQHESQSTQHPRILNDEDYIHEISNRRSKGEGSRTIDRTKKWKEQHRNKSYIEDEELDEHDLGGRQSARARRKRLKEEKRKAKKAMQENAPVPIVLPEYISVTHLANALRVKVDDFLLKLQDLGFEEVQKDHILTSEDAGLIAMEYNYQPTFADNHDIVDLFPQPAPKDTNVLPTRPPVVTIMGHVDHGKTTILDYLRKSSIAATEFGGITQHIGAFSVTLASGRLITFLDTPGHAAFLSMRERGANITDIVVLVVAGDDSVMPQTVEAINHARKAKVPIIVAISKMDKEDANADKVKTDLARHSIEVEDFGGDIPAVSVSGKTGLGIQELEETILTMSEMLDHRADPTGPVEGWIIEASTKKSGRTATVLVRRGTLRRGNILVAGRAWTRVRMLRNEAGLIISEAGPGMPVEVDGWRDTPTAGDEVLEAPNEHKATTAIKFRTEREESDRLVKDMEAVNEARRTEAEKRAVTRTDQARLSNEVNREDIPSTSSETKSQQVVPFIVKADVSGSVEAVVDYISSLGNAEVCVQILRSAVGPPTESDIDLALATQAHIISFNNTIPSTILQAAHSLDVSIIDHNIIYRLIDDVKERLAAKLPVSILSRVTGEADIQQLFKINTRGRMFMTIAGCKVRNGIVSKSSKARVLRGKDIVHQGKPSYLHPISN
jgi:translation initiation factor IF-2